MKIDSEFQGVVTSLLIRGGRPTAQAAVPLLYVNAEGFAVDVDSPYLIEAQLELVGRELTSKFLVKRYNLVKLLNKIKHLLRRSSASTNLLTHLA